MTRVCVVGPSGRMGQEVVRLCDETPGLSLVSAVDAPAARCVGHAVGQAQIVVGSGVEEALVQAQVYVDFTVPEATREIAECAARTGTCAVIGTTGLDAEAERAIDRLAKRSAVVWAPNFSLGVNVLLALAERAARALGADFDAEVVELHHNRKRDAPSGTAIAVANALASGRGWRLDDVKRFTRDGEIGPRPAQEVGVAAVRGGGIVGEHTAYLIGADERLEITHRATSRALFAVGALRAAAWVVARPPGRYSMREVLGLD